MKKSLARDVAFACVLSFVLLAALALVGDISHTRDHAFGRPHSHGIGK